MDASAYARALAEDGLLGDLPWRVALSGRRRTVGFTAESDGAVTIAIPRDADVAEVVAAVRARVPWMVRASGRQSAIAANHPVKEIVDGENFPYLGRPRRLFLVDDCEEDVLLTGDRLLARRAAPRQVTTAIVGWYSRSGAAWLRDRAAHWSRRLGVRPTEVNTYDLGRRWGLRAKDGGIVVHWASFQLSPRLIDFIVVHELAHLAEPHHGPAFRRLVARLLPDHAGALGGTRAHWA